MGILYEEGSVEVTMGINESLESRDAPEAQTEDYANTLSGKLKGKTTSQVWSNSELLPFTKDKKKRCKCKNYGAVYMCDSSYGTGNRRRDNVICSRHDTHDVG